MGLLTPSQLSRRVAHWWENTYTGPTKVMPCAKPKAYCGGGATKLKMAALGPIISSGRRCNNKQIHISVYMQGGFRNHTVLVPCVRGQCKVSHVSWLGSLQSLKCFGFTTCLMVMLSHTLAMH